MLGRDVARRRHQRISNRFAMHVSRAELFQELNGPRVARIVPGSGRADRLPVDLLVDRLANHVEILPRQRNVRFETGSQQLSLRRLAGEGGGGKHERLDRYGHECSLTGSGSP